MSQEEITFEILKQEFLKELADLGREDLHSERSVVATSKKNKVTARRMRLLSDGLTLYGWTSPYTRKGEQIKSNPNVSVVVEYIQIDGIASLLGHPTSEPEFLEIIRKKLPHRYDNLVKNWSANTDRVVVKILPKRIALWKYDDPESGIIGGVYILDVDDKKAYRLDYDSITANHSDAPSYRK